jgi:uncharacterized protein
MEVLLDPFQGFSQADGFEGEDRSIYSLSKFFKLCADANPNINELLWAPKALLIRVDPRWEMLLDKKDLFISKKAKYTYSGYLASQVHKMEKHRQWFLNPPDHKPTRKEYGLLDAPTISGEGLNGLSNVPFAYLAPKFRDEIRREREYRDAKVAWDNYISWRDSRNPIRKEMEEKFGFDTKAALHAFRLMFEGKELLLTGKITFPLPEAEWLLGIRNGLLSYEEVVERLGHVDDDFNKWYEVSTLPYSPNIKGLKELYFDILKYEE